MLGEAWRRGLGSHQPLADPSAFVGTGVKYLLVKIISRSSYDQARNRRCVMGLYIGVYTSNKKGVDFNTCLRN
jgi:hypothetical protein